MAEFLHLAAYVAKECVTSPPANLFDDMSGFVVEDKSHGCEGA